MKKYNTVPVFDTDMTEHLKIDPVKYKIEISMVKMELSDIGAYYPNSTDVSFLPLPQWEVDWTGEFYFSSWHLCSCTDLGSPAKVIGIM